MKILELILVTVIVAGISYPVVAQNKSNLTNSSTDTVAKISDSIVRVVATITFKIEIESDSDKLNPGVATLDSTIKSGATGFVLNKDWNIVTANHVVDEKSLEPRIIDYENSRGFKVVPGSVKTTRLQVVYQSHNIDDPDSTRIYDGRSYFDATLLRNDNLNDIAILSCPILLWMQQSDCNVYRHCNGQEADITTVHGKTTPTMRTIAEYQTDQPHNGEAVAILGFPAVLGTEDGISGPTLNSGRITNPMYVDSENRTLFLAELRVNEGDSGGPVFKESDGKVIGLAKAFEKLPDGTNSGFTRIVPIKYALALLNQ